VLQWLEQPPQAPKVPQGGACTLPWTPPGVWGFRVRALVRSLESLANDLPILGLAVHTNMPPFSQGRVHEISRWATWGLMGWKAYIMPLNSHKEALASTRWHPSKNTHVLATP
jgi:hypothetical protein